MGISTYSIILLLLHDDLDHSVTTVYPQPSSRVLYIHGMNPRRTSIAYMKNNIIYRKALSECSPSSVNLYIILYFILRRGPGENLFLGGEIVIFYALI